MAKNRSFTGGRQAVGRPTLGREAMMQMIRIARDANREGGAKHGNGMGRPAEDAGGHRKSPR